MIFYRDPLALKAYAFEGQTRALFVSHLVLEADLASRPYDSLPRQGIAGSP